jgi:hypothetical protein
MSTKNRITAKGGRGGGKSKALSYRVLRLILEHPEWHILIVSPDFPHTRIIWEMILPLVWPIIQHGGINKTERTIRTITGGVLRFLSAFNPDALRGWNAHAAALDEEKDITDIAIGTVMLCLRCNKHPLIFGAGTPEVGEYQKRYEMLQKDPDSAVFSLPSTDNVFVSQRIFELAQTHMSERLYRQEVLAEFVEVEDKFYVFRREFNEQKNGVQMPILGRDITREKTLSRLGHPYRYIVGVDYNFDYPNYGAIYRIFDDNLWVLVDLVRVTGLASKFGQDLIDRGYTTDACAIIDDASGEYNGGGGANNTPNSSARLMRALGFHCYHPRKNPPIKDRINAFSSKLAPLNGPPTWKYDTVRCADVKNVMENIQWFNQRLDKYEGLDHAVDAMSYPIWYFEPAAKELIPGIRGIR